MDSKAKQTVLEKLPGLSEGPAPPSPLKEYLSHSADLRTAHHPYFTMDPKTNRTPAKKFRNLVKTSQHTTPTSGCAPGFVQANFVAVDRESAFDFMLFCLRNPRPCPLLGVTDPGSTDPGFIAKGSDVATDIPKYWIYRSGERKEELGNIREYWGSGMVGFLLGCSFSWELALHKRGLTPKNVKLGKNVSMYITNISNQRAGKFQGKLVVSMRPYRPEDVAQVYNITHAYPGAHGAPIHWGEPKKLGILDINKPDFGDPIPIGEGEIAVFWACGVTPQTALQDAKLPIAISHAPGHMFVTDLLNEELDVDHRPEVV